MRIIAYVRTHVPAAGRAGVIGGGVLGRRRRRRLATGRDELLATGAVTVRRAARQVVGVAPRAAAEAWQRRQGPRRLQRTPSGDRRD